MIRKKKMFARPRKMYEKSRISEENALLEKYGLKSKKEVWKSLAKVNYFRTRAKALANSSYEDQQVLFNKLNYIGLNVNSIADVLGLKLENILERRLPTVMVKLNLANTAKHARQMVVHKRVLIDGKAVNIPSFLVPVSQEKEITIKKEKVKAPKPTEEVKNE